MAIHSTFKSLGERLVKISKKVEFNTHQAIRGAAATIDIVAVTISPVDEGYFQSRWVVTLGQSPSIDNTPFDGVEIGEELSIALAASQAQTELKKWKGIGPIFISNPLPYAVPLDGGHSTQAPSGMTDSAIAAGQQFLKDARLLGD